MSENAKSGKSRAILDFSYFSCYTITRYKAHKNKVVQG